MSEVPGVLLIGDTWEWERQVSEYPADAWTLAYHFVNAAGAIEIPTTGSGSTFTVSRTPAQTEVYSPGNYRWVARVTEIAGSGRRFTLNDGWTDVKPDPSTVVDPRSRARRTLDAINAVIEGKASSDHMSVSYQGRQVTRMSWSELLQARDRLREEVRVEEMGANAGLGRDIRARFNRV